MCGLGPWGAPDSPAGWLLQQACSLASGAPPGNLPTGALSALRGDTKKVFHGTESLFASRLAPTGV